MQILWVEPVSVLPRTWTCSTISVLDWGMFPVGTRLWLPQSLVLSVDSVLPCEYSTVVVNRGRRCPADRTTNITKPGRLKTIFARCKAMRLDSSLVVGQTAVADKASQSNLHTHLQRDCACPDQVAQTGPPVGIRHPCAETGAAQDRAGAHLQQQSSLDFS